MSFGLLIACKSEKPAEFDSDNSKFLIGQWFTSDDRHPHWIKFDSLYNYYRWSFDEKEPTTPSAKYTVQDSLIYFDYAEEKGLSDLRKGVDIPLIIDSITPNSFRILPIEGEMPIFLYERDTFEGPQYADVIIFYSSKKEVDSLIASGKKGFRTQYEDALQKLNDLSLELEYSLANIQFLDSKFIKTRDSVSYNKFDYDGFGVVYYRIDSTYVRAGIPSTKTFFQEAESFFPISIKSY